MIQETKLLNFDNALVEFYRVLATQKKRFEPMNYYLNHKRYSLLLIDNDYWLIAFKRDFFFTYGKEYPEDNSYGETINIKHLKQALGSCAEANRYLKGLIYLYEDGRIYYITLEKFNEVKRPRVTSAEEREEYCFSIKHLTKWQ